MPWQLWLSWELIPSCSLLAVGLNLLFITLVQDKNEPEHRVTSLTTKCVIPPKGTREETGYLGKCQYLKLLKEHTDARDVGLLAILLKSKGMLSATFFILHDPGKQLEVWACSLWMRALSEYLNLTWTHEPRCNRDIVPRTTKSPKGLPLSQGRVLSLSFLCT